MCLPAPRGRTIARLAVLCLLAAGLAVLAVAAGGAALADQPDGRAQSGDQVERAEAEQAQQEPPFQTGDVDPDQTIIRADIDENGDATWTAEYIVHLETEDRERAFEELAADIEANTSAYTARFEDRATRVVDTATDATDREMRIENVTVTASTDLQNSGVVEYQYTWRGFAVAAGDELRIGDAISGFYLEPSSRLVISWPEAYELDRAEPPPAETDEEAGRVEWQGERSFGPDEPTVLATEPGDSPPFSIALVSAVVLLALLGSIIVARSDAVDPLELLSEGDEQAAVSSSTEEAAAGENEPRDLEKLSSNERVLALLEREGGRMKQQAVTAELAWSAARTSQVVSELEEADSVEVFRVGRENVLKLADGDEGVSEDE